MLVILKLNIVNVSNIKLNCLSVIDISSLLTSNLFTLGNLFTLWHIHMANFRSSSMSPVLFNIVYGLNVDIVTSVPSHTAKHKGCDGMLHFSHNKYCSGVCSIYR